MNVSINYLFRVSYSHKQILAMNVKVFIAFMY
jgi:hypothetical protein